MDSSAIGTPGPSGSTSGSSTDSALPGTRARSRPALRRPGPLLTHAATAAVVAHALRAAAAATGNRALLLLAAVLVGAATLAATATAAWWAGAARTRVDALVHRFRHRRGAAWATLGWFVPLVQIWFPYQVVADIHHAGTLPAGAPTLARPPIERWWLCLLAGEAALVGVLVLVEVTGAWSWWSTLLTVLGLLALVRSRLDLGLVVRAIDDTLTGTGANRPG